MKFLTLLSAYCLCCFFSKGQCPTGQVSVTIQVHTDDYGYEGYWQLVPAGNTCGTGTIFSGGNPNVGCNGGGQQNAVPGSGYGDNVIVTEGPWCLTEGASYDIIFTDDFADGGTTFTVFVNGFPMYTNWSALGDAPGSRLTFTALGPVSSDVSARRITTASYVSFGNVDLTSWVMNMGSATLNSVTLYYSVDNGVIQQSTVSGLNVAPFDSVLVTHTVPWNVNTEGEYSIVIWAGNPNGVPDMNDANDTAYKTITAGPPVPNIIDDYIGASPVLTIIGDESDSIQAPSDLDFHPVLSRYELWVTLRGTENSGGSTVRFDNAGKSDQRFIWQRDGNAWHFMSLPTGIAFSENENFSTSPGVFDANHSGGQPFTGPTLWSSDTTIYAEPSGGNGSHIDMLHQSPYCMGVCSEEDNKFWVFDDDSHDIVYYDFVKDHGPGNSDHSDGIIRRYEIPGIAGDPQHEIPSHLILNKSNNTLYIVDTHHSRILTMDITSGSLAGTLSPYEPVAEYTQWSGPTWTVFADSGLITPSGIDRIDNRLIVSDYSTGDIVIYEIDSAGTAGTEIGRIVTGNPGIQGIKIGPDGKIWYVNYLMNRVIRIDGLSVGVKDHTANNFSVFPNPVNDRLNILFNGNTFSESKVMVTDSKGMVIRNFILGKGEKEKSLETGSLPAGIYTISVVNNESSFVRRFVKE
jgi:hypothetical protein